MKIFKSLRSLGYLLRGILKTPEGTDHPDRNPEFKYVALQIGACQREKLSEASVDTKTKET